MDIEQSSSPLRTAVFIDFEYWYFALKHRDKRPNYKKFMEFVKNHGMIRLISAFADFTQIDSQEALRLRNMTSTLIDCTPSNPRKNHTDFIMLDHIYKTLIHDKSIEQFIIFTGDGHFSSVVTHLTYIMDKIVGVIGLQGSLSKSLKETATWYEEFQIIESSDEIRKVILDSMGKITARGFTPTFSGIIRFLQSNTFANESPIRQELIAMIKDGILKQDVVTIENKPIQGIFKVNA